jgi:hypothetical protein
VLYIEERTMQATANQKRIAVRMRSAVVRAFRRMARGSADKAAYAATISFYRSSGHSWTRQLASP